MFYYPSYYIISKSDVKSGSLIITYYIYIKLIFSFHYSYFLFNFMATIFYLSRYMPFYNLWCLYLLSSDLTFLLSRPLFFCHLECSTFVISSRRREIYNILSEALITYYRFLSSPPACEQRDSFEMTKKKLLYL